MIKFENYEVTGWEHAIRGMRNPMNSWNKSDSFYGCESVFCVDCPHYIVGDDEYLVCDLNDDIDKTVIGPNDLDLMKRLIAGGPVEAKFRRMITVYTDITAPLYWWKEFDTYKVGTVANSCSTMHKIHAKEFTLDDFSHEKLFGDDDMLTFDERVKMAEEVNIDDVDDVGKIIMDKDKALAAISVDGKWCYFTPKGYIVMTCNILNHYREKYLETKDKKYWWQMIQLLPTSYNQKRTVMMNYEVLSNIYKHRLNHKLDEWREMCQWIEQLPYSQIITGEFEKGNPNE